MRKPRGLFGTTDKKAIAEAEERLKKLNVHLIDIQAMNGSEFYMYLKGREKSYKIKNVSSKFLEGGGSVIESISGIVPEVGMAGKMINKGFKSISKTISDD